MGRTIHMKGAEMEDMMMTTCMMKRMINILVKRDIKILLNYQNKRLIDFWKEILFLKIYILSWMPI